MTLLEFRNKEDAEWGKSRVEYAFLDKLALRKRERERKARYLLQNVKVRERDKRGRFAREASEPVRGQVFTTGSGILAYVSTIANLSSGPGSSHVEFKQASVSLPFVSILFPGYEQAKTA